MSKTMLVVDDDDAIRDILSRVAKRLGYDTITAENGQEAVDKADNADLIFMDCDMPVKNGLEALAEIREKYPEKNVLMMTGDISPQREAYFQEHNAEYFTKPFDMDHIIDEMKKYLS